VLSKLLQVPELLHLRVFRGGSLQIRDSNGETLNVTPMQWIPLQDAHAQELQKQKISSLEELDTNNV
jgi:hypothetical protein